MHQNIALYGNGLKDTQPFPRQQILDSSKLKEFADNNFEFNRNGGKFSKRVKNTVGKREIARHEQFLLFHSVYKRLVLQTRKNQGLFGKELTTIFINNSEIFSTPKSKG